MNPSETETKSAPNLYDQACQVVEALKRSIPRVESHVTRFENLLLYRPQVLKQHCLRSKRFFEGVVFYLKLSSEDIRRLDAETCRDLLAKIIQLAPRMQRLSSAWTRKQPFPDSTIHFKDVCQSLDPSEEVLMDEWYDQLFMKLKYLADFYFTILVDGHGRLKELVSEGIVESAKLESLNIALEKSMNLLVLGRADIVRVDKQKCRMWVKMIELFVMGALIRKYDNGDMSEVWPRENLIAISEHLGRLNMYSESDQEGPPSEVGAESSDYRCPPQVSGFPEGDWPHQAYRELQTTRIMCSSKLDKAYNKDYERVLCDTLARTSDKFLKESLEFLATSSTEFASLSKEKCYYRMMLIKLFVFLTKGCVSAEQSFFQPQAASSLPNWRDRVYEEIRVLRKEYSCKLDNEAYSIRRVVCFQNAALLKKRRSCSNILLEESLNFLGCGRADLALVSMVECSDRLARVKRYFKRKGKFSSCGEAHPESSSSVIQPNWRDKVSEEIKSKKIKFLYKFEVPHKELTKLKLEAFKLSAEEATRLKELELSLDRAFQFFTMERYQLAILSAKEYDELVATTNQHLVNIKETITSLQKALLGKSGGYPGDISRIILKKTSVSESASHA